MVRRQVIIPRLEKSEWCSPYCPIALRIFTEHSVLEDYIDYQWGVTKQALKGQWRNRLYPPKRNNHSSWHLTEKKLHMKQPVKGYLFGRSFLLPDTAGLHCKRSETSHTSNSKRSPVFTDLYLWKSPCRKPCCCWDSFTIWRTATGVKADGQYGLLPVLPQNNRRKFHRFH